jgi:hypothetical protein
MWSEVKISEVSQAKKKKKWKEWKEFWAIDWRVVLGPVEKDGSHCMLIRGVRIANLRAHSARLDSGFLKKLDMAWAGVKGHAGAGHPMFLRGKVGAPGPKRPKTAQPRGTPHSNRKLRGWWCLPVLFFPSLLSLVIFSLVFLPVVQVSVD